MVRDCSCVRVMVVYLGSFSRGKALGCLTSLPSCTGVIQSFSFSLVARTVIQAEADYEIE